MSHWNSFAFAFVTAGCLLGETTGQASAQCVQSLSESTVCATEWSAGSVIKLGTLPGFTESNAAGINDVGQVVGTSMRGSAHQATEWSDGNIISLGNLPGATFSIANGINDAGRAVGWSVFGGEATPTIWSGGSAIHLGGLSSEGSQATSINNAGQAVGLALLAVPHTPPSGARAASSIWEACRAQPLAQPTAPTTPVKSWEAAEFAGVNHATEWSGDNIIQLAVPLGSTDSFAQGINDAGQIVGYSVVGGVSHAIEWSGGTFMDLGVGQAFGINDLGQVVGSQGSIAVEWSGGGVIPLAQLPGYQGSQAASINDLGQIVGTTAFFPLPIPEPSTWAMMLAGFAGLGRAGYRRAKAGGAV